MTTDLDARWAVLAAETQHDGMRDSLRRRGVYELGIEAHGRDTVPAAAVIEVELERRDKRDANGQPYQEYEIRGVRQKRMLSGSLA